MNEIDYSIVQPDAALSHVIDSFWMVANNTDQPKDIVVLPDGRIDIHFFYSDEDGYNISIAGLECEPSHTRIAAHSVVFAVSFKLLAVEYILKNSVAPIFNGRALLADNFWGISKSDLAKDDVEKIDAANNSPTKNYINSFDRFCKKISHNITRLMDKEIDTKKRAMFELIYSTKGSASVKEISEAVHWSSRQINRYFTQWFGLSLKAYCTLLRFRASFTHIKQGKLFPENEFSDQAHFIKEIKKYSGYTPKELYKNKDDRFIQLSTLK